MCVCVSVWCVCAVYLCEVNSILAIVVAASTICGRVQHTNTRTGIHTRTQTHTPTRTNTFAHFNHQSKCFVTTFIRHVRHPKSPPAPCVVVSVDVSVRPSVCRSACLCGTGLWEEVHVCVLCRCDCDTSRHLWCRQRQQQRAGFPIIQWEPVSLADNQSHAPISILSAVIFNFIPLRFAKYL